MPEPMTIHTVGSQLHVIMDDGSKRIANKFTNEVYKLKGASGGTPPVGPPTGGGGYGRWKLVSPLPTSLAVVGRDGAYTLGAKQLQNAADIISTCAVFPGMDDDKMKCAIVCALTESVLRIYSNATAWPESVQYPHEIDGSDNASVGLFQQQPNYGWGSVRECMQTPYGTQSFLGGPNGPRKGASPRGLYDLTWSAYNTLGERVQAVQGSAHPERYDNDMGAVQTIMDALIVKDSGGTGGDGFSMPFGKEFMTDDYGPRVSPGGVGSSNHRGIDFGRPGGTPIPSSHAGIVTGKGSNPGGFGNWLEVTASNGWMTLYAHMQSPSPLSVGDSVSKGQILGPVGTTGTSTGNHLHFELHIDGSDVDPEKFIAW